MKHTRFDQASSVMMRTMATGKPPSVLRLLWCWRRLGTKAKHVLLKIAREMVSDP